MKQLTHREMSARGGKAVPADKRTFSVNRKIAREAGRKGGLAKAAKRRAAHAARKA